MRIQLSDHFNYSKLLKFVLPSILMMICTSIYGVVDGLFVSNFVGKTHFAAVNLIMPFFMGIVTVGFMIGTGGSAIVAKTLGEGKKEKANEYFTMLICLTTILGIIVTVLGQLFLRPIITILGAKGILVEYCVTYGRIVLSSMTAFMLQTTFQSFFIVAEKPELSLKISIASGITNMILDFLFIYIFKWGVFGAAFATALSQVVGGMIPLVYFIRKNDTPLRITKAKFDKKALLQTCINGSSEMLTNVSTSLVNMLYNMQLMKFAGADGVVAYGVIMYISFIFSGTYIGYSIGSAPIISYHYGAENKEELKTLLKQSIILLGITSVVMTICAEILAKLLASVFVSYDNNLLEMTTNAIRIFSLSFIISGFNIFASSFFTALNNGLVSAMISFVRTLVFQVIVILVLPILFGLNGIWFAVVVAEILALIVSSVLIIRNKKKYEYA